MSNFVLENFLTRKDMNENRIKHVSITKLWGIKNISTQFYDHVNIFIGANGSSKTTFLNLIEAVLLCDISTFTNIEFESIEITLQQENTSVKVIKINTEDIPTIKYVFNDALEYEIPCTEMPFRSYRYPSRYREAYSAISEELSRLVNISWLSINRDNTSSIDFERGREYMERIRNTVDLKLQDLIKKLIVYQLQLESEANKSANKFKEEVLSLMLYNESVDVFKNENLQHITSTDTNSMKKDLFSAFKALGVARDKSEQIQCHISKIKEVISNISTNHTTSIDDVFVLSLINRTISIIEISKAHEDQTRKIFAPMEKFWKCLSNFMPNKTFELNKDNDGNISISLKEGIDRNNPISITSLSSGEKQLFILLTEALLQKSITHIFIADEPELSLHIEWQRKILSAVLELNPNAQIIVATHSPEVAGNFSGNIVNMKSITSYV